MEMDGLSKNDRILGKLASNCWMGADRMMSTWLIISSAIEGETQAKGNSHFLCHLGFYRMSFVRELSQVPKGGDHGLEVDDGALFHAVIKAKVDE